VLEPLLRAKSQELTQRAPWPPEAKISKLNCNNFCAVREGIVQLSGKQNSTVIPINGERNPGKGFKSTFIKNQRL